MRGSIPLELPVLAHRSVSSANTPCQITIPRLLVYIIISARLFIQPFWQKTGALLLSHAYPLTPHTATKFHYFGGGLHGKLVERRSSFQLTMPVSNCYRRQTNKLTLGLGVFADGDTKHARDLELRTRIVVNLANNSCGKAIAIAHAVLLSVRVPRVDRPFNISTR